MLVRREESGKRSGRKSGQGKHGRLIELVNRITCEINEGQVGSAFEVLVEGVSHKDSTRLTGLTRQNKTINFPGPRELVGRLVRVRATEAHLYGFVGELPS